MKELNNTSLRETLEKLSTSQLDVMLRAELEKEPPDEYAVRLILKVLREREADYPVETNAQIDRAWKEYEHKTKPKGTGLGHRFLKAAVVLIVIGVLMFALPQEVKARSIFDRIAAWTDSIFELFSPGGDRVQTEYVFQTSHPGLQELYDTVTGLGVTVPVVPMWMEEEYVLKECKVTETRLCTKVVATFTSGDRETAFNIYVYSQNVDREYHKNYPDAEQFESDGVFHNIFQNEGLWTAVWTRDNVECSIAIDCQEDVLHKMIKSIYTVEE